MNRLRLFSSPEGRPEGRPKGLLGLFVILAFAAPPLRAQSLENLAGAENAAALRRGEKISRIQFKDISPALIPQDPFLQNLISQIRTSLGPGFFVETLLLYRKPSPGAGSGWTAEERTGLYNQILALSTLAGLQYYSASRKTMRTFYETSTVVSGSDGKSPRADPVYTVPPAELSIYARQKDLSFGDNVYRYDYYARTNALIFVQENLTSMNYGPLPAVGKNRLRSIVAVFDARDSLLIYLASMARAAPVPGMTDRVSASFANRADAILRWFSGQADKVYKKRT